MDFYSIEARNDENRVSDGFGVSTEQDLESIVRVSMGPRPYGLQSRSGAHVPNAFFFETIFPKDCKKSKAGTVYRL